MINVSLSTLSKLSFMFFFSKIIITAISFELVLSMKKPPLMRGLKLSKRLKLSLNAYAQHRRILQLLCSKAIIVIKGDGVARNEEIH